MPVQSTTTAVAPTISATIAPPTAPTTTVPAVIPFAELLAVDDQATASGESVVIDVLANDSHGADVSIVRTSPPSVGSVSVINGRVEVVIPSSFAGEVSFSYTIADESGRESTANVLVVSTNVLAPVEEIIAAQSGEVTSIPEALGRGLTLFTGLLQVRLSTFEASILAFAPIVFGLLRYVIVRRETLVSVTNIARMQTVNVQLENQQQFMLRHDALLWSDGKKRTGRSGGSLARVELRNGQTAWIDEHLVTDTGY